MDNVSTFESDLRQQRLKRSLSAELLAKSSCNKTGAGALSWSMLLEIPDWCHWPLARIEHLSLIAGSIFTAPAIRLWIESKHVEEVRSIIGKDLFDQIMAMEKMPNAVLTFPNDVDLRKSLLSAGASVLLSSIPHRHLRERLSFLLPEPSGVLPQQVAWSLLQQSLTFIEPLMKTEQAI